MQISFTVPGEVVPQGRPRATTRRGKIMMYDPRESKEYKQYVALIGKQYARKNHLEGALSVHLKIYRQTPKSMTKKKLEQAMAGILRPITKPDADNLSKSILDALNGVIYKDDSQIVSLYTDKFYSDKPRVEISIKEIERWDEIS